MVESPPFSKHIPGKLSMDQNAQNDVLEKRGLRPTNLDVVLLDAKFQNVIKNFHESHHASIGMRR